MPSGSKPRLAPTVEEAWASEPELWAEQQDYLGSSDPYEVLWARVPQPTVSPDASFEELPDRIERQCCVGKSCGNTVLLKVSNQGILEEDGYSKRGVQGFGYARESNGDPYFDFETVEDLATMLNDPWYWPNGWTLYTA